MRKILSLIVSVFMMLYYVPVTFATSSTTYSSFVLSYTDATHVSRGETIPITVKDSNGTVLNSANADLSFSSLNPMVATVDEQGNVTGVNAGLAVIAVSLSNNTPALPDQKIVISVINGNKSLQSFESIDDRAWPTTKPRTGERSYAAYSDSGSSFSYRDSSGVLQSANTNSWGGATRQVQEIWFYDDGSSFTNNGPTVFVQRSNGDNMFSFRMGTAAYYAKNETAGFEPTITETSINNTVTRSEGWHQVVFDFTKGNMGNNTGERKVYLDGAVIYSQSYTFDEGGYVAPGQICVQSNKANLKGTLFFDDMNAYCVTVGDFNYIPAVTGVTVERSLNVLTSTHTFSDQNDAADRSLYRWQVSDSASGGFTDINNATGANYTLQNANIGKYIRLKVTPYNGAAYGYDVYSDVFGPIKSAVATDVAVGIVQTQTDGNAVVGSQIKGVYTYNGLNSENNSVYRWLYADSADAAQWTAIDTGTTVASTAASDTLLTVASSLNGKYIKFEITPVDSSGNSGSPVQSDALFINSQKIYTAKTTNIKSDAPDTVVDPAITYAYLRNYDKTQMQVMQYLFSSSLDIAAVNRITSVSVKFYVSGAEYINPTQIVYAYPVSTSDWDKTTATWNSLSGFIDTASPIGSTTVTRNQTGWYEIDITNYVKSQISAGKTGVDIALGCSNIGWNGYLQVRGGNHPQTPPLMVVDWNSPFEVESVSVPVAAGGNAISTNIEITNNTGATQSGTLLIALFSGNRFVDAATESISVTQQASTIITKTLTMSDDYDNYSIRAFVWNNLNDVVPVSGYKVISFSKSDL